MTVSDRLLEPGVVTREALRKIFGPIEVLLREAATPHAEEVIRGGENATD